MLYFFISSFNFIIEMIKGYMFFIEKETYRVKITLAIDNNILLQEIHYLLLSACYLILVGGHFVKQLIIHFNWR